MSVVQVAEHFGVDCSTIRRWITAGCPVVRRGRRGPGGGAVLNVEAVEAWRGRSVVLATDPGWTVDEILEQVGEAILTSIVEAHADRRVNVTTSQAAGVALIVFEQICLSFGKTYHLDDRPIPIRALMQEL